MSEFLMKTQVIPFPGKMNYEKDRRRNYMKGRRLNRERHGVKEAW